jgi:Tol biopolymer transport system component
MRTGRWLLVAVAWLAMGAVVAAADRQGIDCGCEKTGVYSGLEKIAVPELIQYYNINAQSYNSPGGNYHVTIGVQPMAPFPGVKVNINISKNGTCASISSNVLQASWGFSPDDHRFVFFARDLGSMFHIILFDLEEPLGSNDYHLFDSVNVSSLSLGFSPSGRYFAYAAESDEGYLSLKVVDVLEPETDFYYFTPTLGVDHAGWGFSPKNPGDDDAAFFHALNGNAGIVCRLVNLQTMASYSVGADTGTWWGFSPCGDVFGTVDGNAKTVRLYHTGTGQELPGGGWTGMAQDLKPRCDADNHYIGENILCANTADKSCGGGGDTEPPTWGDGASLEAENISYTSLDLSWSEASDNEGVTQYRIYKDDEELATVGADPRQYEVTGLEMGTEYKFSVEAGDAAENWSSGGPTVTVTTLSDSAPTWPDGASLTVKDLSETTVTLEWTAATDDDGISSYRIYQYNYGSDILLGEVDGGTTELALTGLGAYEEYTFYVTAGDTRDQWTKGPGVTVRTLDETPPYWPAPKSLEAVTRNATSIELTWSDANDNVGIYSYNLYVLKGGEWRLAAQQDYKPMTVSCLAPGTSFYFKMEAQDYAWNESTDGPTATISTSSGPADCSAVLGRASVNSDGEETIGAHGPPTEWDPLGWDPHESEYASISADGRYVAFESIGINLVDDDNNTLYLVTNPSGWDAFWHSDVFVHDRQRGKTERVSVSSAGVEGNVEGSSGDARISANGRWVVFSSSCNNLVSDDTNDKRDVFLRDLERGRTFLISRGYLGQGANGHSSSPSVSDDGHLIAFVSSADNLVTGDGNGREDVFLYDRHTGRMRRVSAASDGTEANGRSWGTDMSADGRYISFVSEARNLVDGGSDYMSDVFVYDRVTKETTQVSVSSEGVDGNGRCCMEGTTRRWAARISDEGRYVVFDSQANNLVEGDTNERADTFVHDRQTGVTRRVSVASDGTQADKDCRRSDISGNGRFVVFDTLATTLVAEQSSPYIYDVFIHDMILGTTEKVSRCPCGTDGDGESGRAMVNRNGTAVAFDSYAKNLLLNFGDTNGDGDVFVLEREVTPAVDLSVELTAVPVPARVDKRIICTVRISNMGPDDAEAVAMTFGVPAGVSITGVDAYEGVWQSDGTTVNYELEGLGWNEHVELRIDLLAGEEGPFEAVASVGCEVIEVEEGNNEAVLEIEVGDGSGPNYDGEEGVTGGDLAVFSLDWMNQIAPFADLNDDTVVDARDLAIFGAAWLEEID